MTIMGLDISVYQEQPQYGKLIDWKALKTDPLNFRFIWIKCAEGVGLSNYPITDVTRQVVGAKSVNFEAICGYHFYYYQWFSTVANRWYPLSAIDQAKTFYDAYNQSGFPTIHPMTDIEDPFVGQFLVWSDTATANAALAFARKLNAHLKLYHESITNLFGIRPDIYTGAWWWDRMASIMFANGFGYELDWTKDYKFILADYVGNLDYPIGITPQQTIAWQKTSTPVPPVQGIPTGHSVPGDALDIDQWMQSELEFNTWSGNQNSGGTVSNTYNKDVAQLDRAGFVVLSGDDKQVDMPGVMSGAEAVMLRMGGNDVKEGNPYADSAFPIRANLVGHQPVFGWFNLDANFPLWVKGYNLDPFKNRLWYENETLKILLNSWRKNGISDIEWNAHNLNISATDQGWNRLDSIVFYMSNTQTNPGSTIPGIWQLATLDDMIEILNTFMEGGFIPKRNIYLVAPVEFFKKYDADATWREGLVNRISSGQLKGIGIIQYGVFTEVPMATPFETVEEIFDFAPPDSFNYSFIPYALEDKVKFHIYSWNRFLAQPVKTNNICTPITVGRWCDKEEAMEIETGIGIEFPGPIEPIPDPELEARVKSLETKVSELQSVITKIENYLDSFPKYPL